MRAHITQPLINECQVNTCHSDLFQQCLCIINGWIRSSCCTFILMEEVQYLFLSTQCNFTGKKLHNALTKVFCARAEQTDHWTVWWQLKVLVCGVSPEGFLCVAAFAVTMPQLLCEHDTDVQAYTTNKVQTEVHYTWMLLSFKSTHHLLNSMQGGDFTRCQFSSFVFLW